MIGVILRDCLERDRLSPQNAKSLSLDFNEVGPVLKEHNFTYGDILLPHQYFRDIKW